MASRFSKVKVISLSFDTADMIRSASASAVAPRYPIVGYIRADFSLPYLVPRRSSRRRVTPVIAIPERRGFACDSGTISEPGFRLNCFCGVIDRLRPYLIRLGYLPTSVMVNSYLLARYTCRPHSTGRPESAKVSLSIVTIGLSGGSSKRRHSSSVPSRAPMS